jgi:hypothetical protein
MLEKPKLVVAELYLFITIHFLCYFNFEFSNLKAHFDQLTTNQLVTRN